MRKFWLMAPALALALAAAAPGTARADIIGAGTDYFSTVPGSGTSGTYDSNVPSIGLVDFKGVPFGGSLGNTDTIIQRTADITINGSAGPLLITALQLESTNLSTPIFISLDPTLLSSDTGTMTIVGNSSGGTFDSALNVFFDVCTTPGVNGVGCGIGAELGTGMLDFTFDGLSLVGHPCERDRSEFGLLPGPHNRAGSDGRAQCRSGDGS